MSSSITVVTDHHDNQSWYMPLSYISDVSLICALDSDFNMVTTNENIIIVLIYVNLLPKPNIYFGVCQVYMYYVIWYNPKRVGDELASWRWWINIFLWLCYNWQWWVQDVKIVMHKNFRVQCFSFRVVQKSLVFIVGLSTRLANAEVCKGWIKPWSN